MKGRSRHISEVAQRGDYIIPAAVMERADIKPTSKIVYGCLKRLAWRDSEVEYTEPAQQEIADLLKLTTQTVMQCLRELRRAPAIEGAGKECARLIVSKRRGLGLPNIYMLPSLEVAESDISGTKKSLVQEPQDLRIPRARDANQKPKTNPKTLTPRPRNLVYDALAEVCEIRPELLDPDSPIFDKDQARALGVAQASIRNKAKGLDDETLAAEVRTRAAMYRAHWPEVDLTPRALAKHWNTVTKPTPQRRRMRAGDVAAAVRANIGPGPGRDRG